MTCTWLVENGQSELRSMRIVHGMSCCIQTAEGPILFDCGPDGTLCDNARLLGIDLSAVKSVILSHSHYDHAGGFPFLEAQTHIPRLVVGPHFFEPKYARHQEVLTYLGCGFSLDYVKAHAISLVTVEERMEIVPNLWVVGGFSSTHAFERIPQRFVKQTPRAIVPDSFEDEICLVVVHDQELTMLVGCSHVGVSSMTARVETLFGLPVTKLYGGFHLGDSDNQTIAATLHELESCHVRTLGMCHCSGAHAIELASQTGRFTLNTIHSGDMVEL